VASVDVVLSVPDTLNACADPPLWTVTTILTVSPGCIRPSWLQLGQLASCGSVMVALTYCSLGCGPFVKARSAFAPACWICVNSAPVVHAGSDAFCVRSSPEIPATSGAAIEVPLHVPYVLFGSVLVIPTPGARTA